MSNEYGIPSTVDTAVLSMSLSDYQKRLVDNVYNDVVILKLCNEAGTKKSINGGLSIFKSMVDSIKNLAKSVDILCFA